MSIAGSFFMFPMTARKAMKAPEEESTRMPIPYFRSFLLTTQTLVTLSYSALQAKYTRLSVIHNGLTHHTVPEEEKEEPRRGHSPHTSGSPPRNIPLRHSRGRLALARLSHPIELLRLLRKNARTSPDYEFRSAYQKSKVSHA